MNVRERYTEIINGMNSEDQQIQWETMVKWCSLWIEVENQKLQPLLDLIYTFKALGFWSMYYPSQSKRALGLSLGKNYDERCRLPMVYIIYNSSDHQFAIQYQKVQGGETICEVSGKELSSAEFQKITNWLTSKKEQNEA